MTLSLVIATVLTAVAIVATYFVARATLAIVAIRDDAAEARDRLERVVRRAEETEALQRRTRVQFARVLRKVYSANKEIEAMLADPTVQRALRREGRQ